LRSLALAACLLLSACASGPAPQRSPLARWPPSPNESARRPELIVLHHTAIPALILVWRNFGRFLHEQPL